MFYLRRVLENNVINDQVLGSNYSLIESFTNQDEFNRNYKILFKLSPEEDIEWSGSIFGFIVTDSDIIPLYKKSKYYVMTENGKTFNTIIF